MSKSNGLWGDWHGVCRKRFGKRLMVGKDHDIEGGQNSERWQLLKEGEVEEFSAWRRQRKSNKRFTAEVYRECVVVPRRPRRGPSSGKVEELVRCEKRKS